MQGLIVKDLINLRKQLLYYGVFLALYLVLAVKAGMSDFFGTVIALMSAMLPVTALAYDERAKWDRYALSMPVSRRDIVLAKYLLGILLALAAFMLNVIFRFFVGGGADLGSLFLSPVIYSGAGLFFLAILLPLLFRFGVERGRILMILVACLPAAAIAAVPQIDDGTIGNFFSSFGAAGVLAAMAVCYIVSILISMRIYARKEIQ